jgi:hypothetical protein
MMPYGGGGECRYNPPIFDPSNRWKCVVSFNNRSTSSDRQLILLFLHSTCQVISTINILSSIFMQH